MGKDNRRAKVTPETKHEAKTLAQLWATRAHPSQAVFGEMFGIGNQSAVGQFLRGDTPLSLKAARGFAQGLSCRIEDFSPRLAKEAAELVRMVPGEVLLPEVAAVASAINELPAPQRAFVLDVVHRTLEATKHFPASSASAVTESAADDGGNRHVASSKRMNTS